MRTKFWRTCTSPVIFGPSRDTEGLFHLDGTWGCYEFPIDCIWWTILSVSYHSDQTGNPQFWWSNRSEVAFRHHHQNLSAHHVPRRAHKGVLAVRVVRHCGTLSGGWHSGRSQKPTKRLEPSFPVCSSGHVLSDTSGVLALRPLQQAGCQRPHEF